MPGLEPGTFEPMAYSRRPLDRLVGPEFKVTDGQSENIRSLLSKLKMNFVATL